MLVKLIQLVGEVFLFMMVNIVHGLQHNNLHHLLNLKKHLILVFQLILIHQIIKHLLLVVQIVIHLDIHLEQFIFMNHQKLQNHGN